MQIEVGKEYRTRDGRRAIVTKDWKEDYTYRFDGRIFDADGSSFGEDWTVDGRVFAFKSADTDIIGPWVEPEPAIDAGTPEQFEAPEFVEIVRPIITPESIVADAIKHWRDPNASANSVGDYGSVAVPSALAEQREVDEARESAATLAAALRIMLDEGTQADAALVARAVLEVHGQ